MSSRTRRNRGRRSHSVGTGRSAMRWRTCLWRIFAMTVGSSSADGRGTSSALKIVVNIFISFIGAGVLGLPFAFKRGGLIEGILIMIAVAYFAYRAMLLILECKYTILMTYGRPDRVSLMKNEENDLDDFELVTELSRGYLEPTDRMTYSDVGYFAAGLVGKRLVDLTIVVSQIGFCCAYLIFIMENLTSYAPYIGKATWLFLMLPLLFLLSLYREIHKLAFFSLFAQVSNLMAFAVVFWFDFESIAHTSKRAYPNNWSLDGFPFFFAVSIYCYEGAGMILALESSVAKPVRHKFKEYFQAVIICVTFLYIAFGTCGYLSFGEDTNPIITLNLAHGHGMDFAKLVKSCLCLSLFFTYPMMLFPVTQILEKTFLEHNAGSLFQENCLRLILVASTGFVVLMIPSFADLMALIGATCCTLVTFILPGTFHLLLHTRATDNEKYLNYFLIIFGLLGALVGTMDTLDHMGSSAGHAIEPTVIAKLTSTFTPTNTQGNISSGVPFSDLPETVNGTLTTVIQSVVQHLVPTTSQAPKIPSTSTESILHAVVNATQKALNLINNSTIRNSLSATASALNESVIDGKV